MAKRTVPPLVAALFLAAIIGPATAVAQEPPPELALSVDLGPPGTVVELSGSGWPDPTEIVVTWQFTDVELAANVSIIDGSLDGTAAIPIPFRGGPGGIEVCAVSSAGGEQCASAFFSVTPVASVTPGSGFPGQTIEVTGEGWAGRSARVFWQPDGRELGQVEIDQQGTVSGQVQIPPDLTEGLGAIEVCVLDVDVDTCAPPVDFQVTQPTVRIDPPEAPPGSTFLTSGEGWCCPCHQGTLVEAGTENAWGTLQVGADGILSGTAVVPEDAPEGEVILRVCLEVRCDIDVVFTVLTGEPATTVSGQTTATTTPSTSIASSSTAATVPGGDECALAPESLGVEPAGGDPGTEVAVSFVAADPIPGECPVIIRLGGEQVSPQILLLAGAEVDLTIVVPDGIALGLNNLEVTDPRDQRVLGAIGFEVGGVGVSWIRVAAVAGVLLLLAGGGYVLWRMFPRHPDMPPPPSGPLMPRFDAPAGVVAGEPFEARLRFEGGPSEPLEVQFAADGYLAPQGLRRPVVVAGGGPGPTTASAVLPLVAEPAESPEVRRVVAYLFQHGHLVGWAQTSPTVVPPGAPLPTGLATAAAIPLGKAAGAPPDLTLTLTRANHARYLDWGFGSPHPVALPRTRITTDLEQDDARAFAHDAVLSVAQTEPGFIRMKLAGVSKVIGGRIPSETWRTLESVTPFATAEGRTPVLLVVSEEPYVPWDLAMVPEALRLDPESPPLLGCQLVTGRWMPPDAADGLNPGHPTLPPPVEVDVGSMAVVVHQADGGAAPLPAALEEAEHLRNEYGAVVVPARVGEVAALLEESYRAGGPVVLPDVLHLACHGEADPASPSRSGLLLWAGPGNWTSLSPDVLRGAPLVGDRHPFVFINACEAGTPLQGLDGFGGLVGACLKEGARGVIAPLWKVGDRPAGQVATGFYEHVLAGTDRAGDAMRLLRSDPHHEEPVWDRDLLAYTYFGHPMLRLVGHDLTD